MLISVVMATYNGASYVRDQLESIAAQSRLPDELVVNDDGSSDGTLDIVEAFATRSPFRVDIERNRCRLGVSRNFERALARSTGDVVFLADQDDLWCANKIEHVLVSFCDPRVQLVVHDATVVDASGDEQGSLLDRVIARHGDPRHFVSGCCTAARRSLITRSLPFPGDVGFDEWLHLLAMWMDARTLVSAKLIRYRRHSSNVSPSTLYQGRPAWTNRLAEVRAQIGRQLSESPRTRLQWQRSHLTKLREDGRDELLAHQHVLLRKRLETVDRRLTLVNRPRYRRLFPVAALYLQGGYSLFSGWKSAITDLLTPVSAL
jgi:glycosyltransferase involved in cell wall biosynthesis